MVKKIQIIDDDTQSNEEMDTVNYQRNVIKLLESIDWKLWEIYKFEKERREDKSFASTPTNSDVTEETNLSYPPVRVDDD